MDTINTTTMIAATKDNMGIKVKILRNVLEDFKLNEKTISIQVFKGACKQYHRGKRRGCFTRSTRHNVNNITAYY